MTIQRLIATLILIAGIAALIIGSGILLNDSVHRTVESSLITFWEKQPPPPHSLPPRWMGKVHLLGYEALILGILICLTGAFLVFREKSTFTLLSRTRVQLWVAVVLLIGITLPVILAGHSGVIGGERIWWLGDDPMISMRYARNLAQGHGLVYNPGEPVEGYTNFLWALCMAGAHLLPVSTSGTSFVVLLINLIFAVLLVPLLLRLVRILGGGPLTGGLTLLAYVLNRDILFCTTAGFETALLTLLFIWGLCRILEEAEKGSPRLKTYLIAGVMALVRADAVLLSGLLIGLSLIVQKKKKAVLAYGLLSMIFPAGHLLFRLGYYGEWLPNTAYLKVVGWSERFGFGLRYVLGFIQNYFLLLLAAALGAIRFKNKNQILLTASLFFYMVYVFYVGGDAFHHFRFFIPFIPLLFILAFMGLEALVKQNNRWMFAALALIILSPLAFPGYSLFYLLPRTADRNNVELALTIKQNTPAEAKVADDWAGNMFYFCERYAIDLLGKSDRMIAHMGVASKEARPGHNKFDYDYSLGQLKPDVLVSHFKLPVDENDMHNKAGGHWAFVGQLYFHPLFQKHCLPNAVNLDTWRSVFICDWSPLLPTRDQWRKIEQKGSVLDPDKFENGQDG